MEVSVQVYAPPTLFLGKGPRQPLDGPQGRCGHGGDEKNLCSRRESNVDESILNLSSILL
jgi:hypothetical protein